MYDIIGDIHGHSAELKLLLQKMDYKLLNGVWQHESRKVIFLGDYIDRGPEIRETLHIVRSMTESGNAIALLGNHEYNAMAYHHQHNGDFLRKHTPKNITQHAQTLAQFYFNKDELQQYLQWFYTLPLYIDLPELRAVHACWDDAHIDWLKKRGYNTINEELLIKSHAQNSISYTVMDDVLKGKEVNIPEQFKWKDKGNHYRTSNRIKWWKDAGAVKKGEFLFDCPPVLSEEVVEQEVRFKMYPQNAPPVFFGHYWLEGCIDIQASNVVCLDYSVAKGGSLAAYRFDGEQTASKENFIYVATQAQTFNKKMFHDCK